MKIKVGKRYDAFDASYKPAHVDRGTKFDMSDSEWTFLIIAKIRQGKKTAYVGVNERYEISNSMFDAVHIFDVNGVCLSGLNIEYKLFSKTTSRPRLLKDIQKDSDK